jgi:hypothetical protein
VRKSLASGVGVAAALVVVFGSGNSSADGEYNGQTYAKVAESFKSFNGTLIIATRVGSYLPTEQCIVVGSRKTPGSAPGWLLDLNCNDTSALNGHPGNSMTTASAQKVHQIQATAKNINRDFAKSTAAGKPSWCEEHLESCQKFCANNGAEYCSDEVKQFLGV